MTSTIYRDGSKAIKFYEKISMSDVEREVALQEFARKAGLPVPEVYGIRELENGAIAIDMQYIAGQPLMHKSMNKDERAEALLKMIRLQRKIHEVDASQLASDTNQLNHLCHGDIHPLNILWDGEKHWIIDWVDAHAGDPLADALRTYNIFQEHIKRMAGMYLRFYCKEAGVSQDEILNSTIKLSI